MVRSCLRLRRIATTRLFPTHQEHRRTSACHRRGRDHHDLRANVLGRAGRLESPRALPSAAACLRTAPRGRSSARRSRSPHGARRRTTREADARSAQTTDRPRASCRTNRVFRRPRACVAEGASRSACAWRSDASAPCKARPVWTIHSRRIWPRLHARRRSWCGQGPHPLATRHRGTRPCAESVRTDLDTVACMKSATPFSTRRQR